MNLGSLIPWRDHSPVPTSRKALVDPFVAFRKEVDRIFDDFIDGFDAFGIRPDNGGRHGIRPSIDLTETDSEVVVTTDLPGLDENDVEVTVAGDVLTIRGEKKAEHEEKDGHVYYAERRYGAFSRSVRLPFDASDEEVEARYAKGVLTVRVPKPAGMRQSVRHIEVKAA